ncbi:MAG: hypothetical protein EOP06_16275 [Proteobacteria bacterium]|nr:MAG: hypothetical protein EOP06_16275 [Pseudomonadota bacterium]
MRKHELTTGVSDLKQLYIWTLAHMNEFPNVETATIQDITKSLKISEENIVLKRLSIAEKRGELVFHYPASEGQVLARWEKYSKVFIIDGFGMGRPLPRDRPSVGWLGGK